MFHEFILKLMRRISLEQQENIKTQANKTEDRLQSFSLEEYCSKYINDFTSIYQTLKHRDIISKSLMLRTSICILIATLKKLAFFGADRDMYSLQNNTARQCMSIHIPTIKRNLSNLSMLDTDLMVELSETLLLISDTLVQYMISEDNIIRDHIKKDMDTISIMLGVPNARKKSSSIEISDKYSKLLSENIDSSSYFTNIYDSQDIKSTHIENARNFLIKLDKESKGEKLQEINRLGRILLNLMSESFLVFGSEECFHRTTTDYTWASVEFPSFFREKKALLNYTVENIYTKKSKKNYYSGNMDFNSNLFGYKKEYAADQISYLKSIEMTLAEHISRYESC